MQCLHNTLDTAFLTPIKLVLPNPDDLPAKRAKLSEIALVPVTVCPELLSPELRQFSLPGWEPPSMPEIAVDKDGNSAVIENDVRTSR